MSAYATAEEKLLERIEAVLLRIEKLLTPKIALTATAVHHPNRFDGPITPGINKTEFTHPRRALAESEEFHIDNPDHNS